MVLHAFKEVFYGKYEGQKYKKVNKNKAVTHFFIKYIIKSK